MRKICYVSGTRADFGLMQATLQDIHSRADLELSIVVTGMHLVAQYGFTVGEIERAQLPISARIDVDMSVPSGATMARNIGLMLIGITGAFERIAPDIVLLLGDRGEMLAGALAAIHLNIPVVHIHGGERSGTVDEPVRHAISKLSHFHFTATEDARNRLVRMGEHPERVYVTGAPGLDGLTDSIESGRNELLSSAGLRTDLPVALMVYHPVLQEEAEAGREAEAIVGALKAKGIQIVAVMPNADAGSDAVRSVLNRSERDGGVHLAAHIPRERFVAWMAAADLMIGNSSAGIIEAASFGIPVINVGSRQGMRERNLNVADVVLNAAALDAAIGGALSNGRFTPHNVFGDGKTAPRIASLLAAVVLDKSLMEKTNAY